MADPVAPREPSGAGLSARAVLAVAVAAALHPWQGQARPPPPVAVPVAGQVLPAARLAQARRIENLATILARPLFAPGRRPAAAGAAPDGTYHLVGTVVEAAGVRWALIAPSDGRPTIVAREGMRAGPFVIRRIEADHVLADRASASVILTLAPGRAHRVADPPADPPAMTKDPRSRAAANQDE